MTRNEFIRNRGQFLQSVKGKVPSKKETNNFLNELTEYLFPVLSESHTTEEEIDIDELMVLLQAILKSYDSKSGDINQTVNRFRDSLPDLYELLIADAMAIYEGDPAATSVEEVVLSYPGFYAILVYRIAHELDNLSVAVIPRMLTEFSHGKTGIDIHPKAQIGKSFCIDHGTGIVVGETTVIGDAVKIYQGVTLGATSVAKEHSGKKRHPTIKDDVIIYSGATVLGGETIVGHHSIIGGSVWLTHSVDPYSVVLDRSRVHLRNNDPHRNEIIDYVI
ncbi:MAG: serine acetyltransferase [bacterium]|nr:MAG: serine acetyltransferase [bacterium]